MYTVNDHLRALLSAACAMVLSGTIFYRYSENWEWMDALYFSVVTMATVGYGDHVPTSFAGKIFTIPYILISVIIFLMLANAISHYFHDYHNKKRSYRKHN